MCDREDSGLGVQSELSAGLNGAALPDMGVASEAPPSAPAAPPGPTSAKPGGQRFFFFFFSFFLVKNIFSIKYKSPPPPAPCLQAAACAATAHMGPVTSLQAALVSKRASAPGGRLPPRRSAVRGPDEDWPAHSSLPVGVQQ